MSGKRATAALGLAIVLLAFVPAARLAWLSRDNPHLGFIQDDALYWVTAKSVAEGHGYRSASLPGEPLQTKYPPLFPWLLALVWKVDPSFPANQPAAVALMWLAVPVFVLLWSALLTRWGISGKTRLLLIVAVAVNPCLAFFGTVLLSEVWGTCLILLSLLVAERASEESARLSHAALAGICSAAACLFRSAAAPLLLAIPIALLWFRRRRAFAVFLSAALPPVIAWHAWAAAHRTPATDSTWLYYLDYLGFWAADIRLSLLPAMVYHNVGEMLSGGGDLLLFQLSTLPAGKFLARLVMIAAVAGLVRWARRVRRPAYPLFAAGLCALLIVWDFPPNERFLLPALPLLTMGLWTELSHLGQIILSAWRRHEFSQRFAAAVMAALAGSFLIALGVRNLQGSWTILPEFANQSRAAAESRRPVYEWIARNTPPDAVLFADRDVTLHLQTGRNATAMHVPNRYFYAGDRAGFLANFARLNEFVLARRLDYVLLTPADFELDPHPEEQRRAVREALSRDTRFKTVFDSPAGTVVEVVRHGD